MANSHRKENIRRIVFAILAVAMMGLIFWFSDQGAESSSEQSQGVSYTVAKVIRPGFKKLSPEEKAEFVDAIEEIIRKCAHFLEYTLLGILLLGAYSRKGRKHLKSCLFALGTAAFYSVTDEIHQNYVPGRSCEIRDMCIDTSGALTGIICMTLLLFLAARIHVWLRVLSHRKQSAGGAS